ncbi:hypothetical protein JSQ81_05210 [Sporosarcina sp. Marseille-Q4063]|uniref:hypothetical protein n=1 Tax=Sporosarcina sp. Marseille-Q4063 TaxID=2810514 RepID=UPI001BB09C40|nr:hypothetical protein [Sporosarcina sp. Marseille-Q4063]QUW22975.1 hypothetical protein JSQ81_05210 [Sporosarcina sp. Marseille-Q4063]
MRKYLVLLTILSILALAACGKTEKSTEKPVDNGENNSEFETTGNKTAGSEQGLKLQVIKGDAEVGVTVENNELYSELDKIIQENPDMGAAGDFSLYVVDTLHDEEGNSKLVILGINRLPVAIKNFEFNYTLGNKDEEFVWEKQPVEMKEEIAGILQPNSALPIVLPLTDEQKMLVKSLKEGNIVMSIEDFKYEEVK